MSDPNPFALEGVSKTYRRGWPWGPAVRVLTDITLRGEPGEVLGLVGPNRSGKTTLVKLVLGLCRPSTGTVTRFGLPVEERGTLQMLGYVPERPVFPAYLSATEVMMMHGALAGWIGCRPYADVSALMEDFGLTEQGDLPVGRFSKGMTQRLAICQAVVNSPALLVLDEPFEGLDEEGRALVLGAIRERRHRGQSTLLITHLAGIAETMCDRLAQLDRGRLVSVRDVSGQRVATIAGTPRRQGVVA